jgi:hypothetical protein
VTSPAIRLLVSGITNCASCQFEKDGPEVQEQRRETIAKALEETWRPEHLLALRQAYDLYQFHHHQIAECDRMIRDELARLYW